MSTPEHIYAERTQWHFSLSRLRQAVKRWSVFWTEMTVGLMFLGVRGLYVLLDARENHSLQYMDAMQQAEWVWGTVQATAGFYMVVAALFGPRQHRAAACAVGCMVCMSTALRMFESTLGTLSPAALLWLTVGAIPAGLMAVRHTLVLADPIDDYPYRKP